MKHTYILFTLSLLLLNLTCEAQTLRSAYFTPDYKYRHTLNPAFGNDQGYVSMPALGNLSIQLQGNFGLEDVFFQDPATGKYSRTLLHPDVSASEVLSGLNNENRIEANIDITLLSAGFRAFGGYNTIELNAKTMVGLSLPYELFEFAKNIGNKEYQFDFIGARAMSYAEVALGHSHQLNDNLRIGAKLKFLVGAGRADLNISDMKATLTGNEWKMTTDHAVADVNVKGIRFENKTDDYKQEGKGSYEHIDLGNTSIDKGGANGFGLGIDLGAEYRFQNSSITALKPLRLSAALTDLGFISWSDGIQLVQKQQQFIFHGFHEVPVKEEDENGIPQPNQMEDQTDSYADQLSDFIALEKGKEGGQTTGLAATLNLGAEYALPVYERLTFGLLMHHRFFGEYSWTEGRLSANWAPLSWLDGGVSLAVGTYSTSMGWVLNVHPVGMNFFIGMDHILGKQSKEGIPLSSNVSFCLGMNVAWGKAHKKKKETSRYRRLL